MEKRIWNEMELKSMSDWEYYDNSWHKFGETFTITDAMVGEVVTNILKSRFTIKDWMVTDLQQEETNNTDLELTESIAGIMKNPLFKIEYNKDSNSLNNDAIESNIKKRILNLQEIKSLGLRYGRDDSYQGWFSVGEDTFICDAAVGKTVEWCKLNGYVVKDWMIANTEEESNVITGSSGLFNITDPSIVKNIVSIDQDGVVRVNGKTYIEKPTPKTVTLDNGTVLEVGKKYVNKGEDNCPFEIIFITEKYYYYKILGDSDEGCYKIDLNEDLIPYTEKPVEKPKEWKTFLIEHEYSNGVLHQVIERYLSIEDCKKCWTGKIGAKSITEVKVNIEEVL